MFEKGINFVIKNCQNQLRLESNQALMQSFFDNSPVAIIIYGVKGDGATSEDYVIQKANPTCLKWEKLSQEEILGKTAKEIRPGIDDFGIIEVFQQVWETGEAAYYPARVYREGEKEHWYKNTVFRLPTGEIVAVYDDITERVQAEQELFAEKEKLRITLHSIGDGVITTDKLGRVELINQVAEGLTGWKQEEARNKPLTQVFDIYNEETNTPCESPVDAVLKSNNIVTLANHTILRAKDGRVSTIADSAAPIKNQQEETLGVVLVFRDVTETKQKEEKIKFLSFRDALTGLYNRAFFEEELKRLNTKEYLPIALIIGDLDGLKLINDAFGHQVGDQALIKVTQILHECCRKTDVIARWGGDEFVILLPKTSAEAGQRICDRIKDACSELSIEGTRLSISLGYTVKHNTRVSWETIIKQAEDYMYRSKLLGKMSYRSSLIASIKNTLFEKSCETEDHGERLGHYCREIGRLVGLSSSQIDELEILAKLHDLGKIAIDEQILQKPSKLTPHEWEIIKKHPEIGHRIALTSPDLIGIADYILTHHERWDGKGYPRRLVGEEIPLLARILAVVDAYDAMTHDRPYRKALSIKKARKELQRGAGSQFDPRIVDVFLKNLCRMVYNRETD